MPTIPATIPFTVGDPDTGPAVVSALPVLTVQLDDGTGTFPFDITGYCNLSAGVPITRGRGDEFGTVEASTLQLQLDNLDGRFTAGGSGPYGVFVDQQIRVLLTKGAVTSPRFTGYVQEWPTQWPSPTGAYAVAQITAVDAMPRLARRKLRSIVIQELLLDDPDGYWPLSEGSDARSAGDVSSHQQSTLAAVGAESGQIGGEKVDFRVVFGAEIGGARKLGTGAKFVGNGQALAGRLRRRLSTTEGATVSLFGKVEPGTDGTLVDIGWLQLYVGAHGFVHASIEAAGFDILAATTIDDAPHYVAAAVQPTTNGVSVKLIIDDAVEAIGNTDIEPQSSSRIQVGAVTGTIAHVAVWAANLPILTMRRHASLGLDGVAGEPPETRIARLAAYVGAGDRLAAEVGITRSLANQDTADAAALDAMRLVETSEGGLLFFSAAGELVLQNRRHRALAAANPPALSVTADDLVDRGNSFVLQTDTQFLINEATGAAQDGGTQVVRDNDSIARHELYPHDVGELLITDDDAVLDRLAALVNIYREPYPRGSAVPVDLLTASLAKQQAALAVEISDRLQVTALPSQAPTAAVDLIVEGWTETVSDASWSMTFNTSPASAAQMWVLGTSALGESTRLGY